MKNRDGPGRKKNWDGPGRKKLGRSWKKKTEMVLKEEKAGPSQKERRGFMKKLFTSESITEGHPDKLCDYISDSILDSYLEKDKNARVACETVAGKGEILVTGEITSKADGIDIEKIVRNAIKEIGYDNADLDIDYRTCKVHLNISKQSPDIA